MPPSSSSCQRAVRWGDHLFIRTDHDGYHGYEPHMLFDLATDPHEQRNLAAREPGRVQQALALIAEFEREALARGHTGVDPLQTVLREGGPYHVRGQLAGYLARLRATGRARWAEWLEARHCAELPSGGA